MLEALIRPRTRDLGDGFEVRRALPAAEKRAVGPFVFFDQMGPVALAPGRGLDVRPHPHIGLATVTYLFEGEILHRDSLGTVQPIRPGDVNWMTAGRGIVHSERTPQEQRAAGARVSGIQTWVGLPADKEETAPAFVHVARERLPLVDDGAASLRLILGELRGMCSPVQTLGAMFYADLELAKGARFAVEFAYTERAAYVAQGSMEFAGEPFAAGQLLVFPRKDEIVLTSPSSARVLLLGGEPLDGQRFMWWNFVSRRRERIRAAAEDWRTGRFAPVPGETDFIPLPQAGVGVANYP